jgi:tetratricopeptide (TPR) repeat protein
MKSKGLWFFVICFVLSFNVKADFPKPVISKIPLYRLVVNLENLKASDPDNPHHYYALGRLYAMAYSFKKDTLDAVVKKGDDDYTPFYGFHNLNHFFPVKELKDSSKTKFVRGCLNRAIENFNHAISLDTTYIPSWLGLAWSLDQQGDRETAIKLYRRILNQTGRQEKSGYISTETVETAGYLVRLLDKEKDSVEISRLQKKISSYKPNYMISPVLIPLSDFNSFGELVDTSFRARFDLDGTGAAKSWEWITEKAGWLVYLRPGEKIESGRQLFGNCTFNIFWENGYEAMRSMDDDLDGRLAGPEIEDLAVWQDRNSNGVHEEGETFTLRELQIESLNYSFETLNSRLLKSRAGVKLKNGTTRDSFDWYPKGTEMAL